MSEWLLSAMRNSPTSKLNTRVRFPSPAPFCTLLYDLVRYGTLLNDALSRRPPSELAGEVAILVELTRMGDRAG
jgi:hypothetical protein